MGSYSKNENGDFELEVPLHGKPISAISLSKGDRVSGPQGVMEILKEPREEDGSAILVVRALPNLKVVGDANGKGGHE